MKIAIGADHAGFQLKEELRANLSAAGHEVIDYGTPSDVTFNCTRQQIIEP